MACLCRMPQSGFIHGSSAFLRRQLRENGHKGRRFLGTQSALDEHMEARRTKFKANSNAYLIPVLSFVKSHMAANAGKYPTIALTMQETGGSKYIIQKILHGMKTGHIDVNVEESSGSCQKTNNRYTVPEKVSSSKPVFHSSDVKELKTDIIKVCDVERFDQVEVDRPLKDADKSSALKSVRGENMLVHCDVEHLDQMNVGSTVKDTDKNIFQDLMHSTLSEHAWEPPGHTENMLPTVDKVSESRAFSTPLRPLYQRTVASRRVNLSAEMGLESDLSWKETLNSIFPEMQDGPKKKHTPNQTDVKTATMPARQYGILILGTKPVRGNLSKAELRKAFEHCGEILKARITPGKDKWQACVYFKREEGLKEALKMKPAFVKGEEVTVKNLSLPTGEETVERLHRMTEEETVEHVHHVTEEETVERGHQVTEEEMKSVVSQIVNKLANIPQSRSSSKASYVRLEKVPTSSSSRWSNDALYSILNALNPVKSSLLPNILNRVQNIVSIEKYPTHLRLDSLKDYFSRYGEVTCCHAAACNGSDLTCYVEFQNKWDKQKALEIQQFIIDRHIFEIRNHEAPETSTIVRLENIDSETSIDKVKSVCGGYGTVIDVKAIDTNTVNVQFELPKDIQIGEILDRLNEATVDKRRWQATLLCHGYQRVGDLKSTCEVCLQRQEDNLKLLSLVKQLLVHVEDMCARVG